MLKHNGSTNINATPLLASEPTTQSQTPQASSQRPLTMFCSTLPAPPWGSARA